MSLSIRQHGRYRPLHLVADAKRNAAKISGFHLREPDVNHGYLVTLRNLGNNLRLSDARWSPKHYRRVLTVLHTLEFGLEDS